MYPIFRFAKEMQKFRRAPALGPGETHVSHHVIWPWDIDFWWELNNGRTLTLYDLGRVPFAMRSGVWDGLKRQGWGLTVAGSLMRYRRRLTTFSRVEMRTRYMGRDAKFIYIEQSMWKGGDCANHGVIRSAVISNRKMVPTDQVCEALGIDPEIALPDWVAEAFAADDRRPWPPMQG